MGVLHVLIGWGCRRWCAAACAGVRGRWASQHTSAEPQARSRPRQEFQAQVRCSACNMAVPSPCACGIPASGIPATQNWPGAQSASSGPRDPLPSRPTPPPPLRGQATPPTPATPRSAHATATHAALMLAALVPRHVHVHHGHHQLLGRLVHVQVCRWGRESSRVRAPVRARIREGVRALQGAARTCGWCGVWGRWGG